MIRGLEKVMCNVKQRILNLALNWLSWPPAGDLMDSGDVVKLDFQLMCGILDSKSNKTQRFSPKIKNRAII